GAVAGRHVGGAAARIDQLAAAIGSEHVADLDAVARPAIDDDDRVLPEFGDAAVDRHDRAGDLLVGRTRDVARETGLARGREPVAALDFLARLRDLDGGRVAITLHARIADVLGLVSK